MPKTLANVRIYGDNAGAVAVAPKGTTPPVDLAAISTVPAYLEVGWISEDGVPVSRESSSSPFRAWQGGTIVRRRVTSNEDTFKFQMLEETRLAYGLYYPGATFTAVVGGITRIGVKAGAVSDVRAWLLDFVDGGVQKRYVIPTAEITARGTIPHKNDAMTIFDYTCTIYGDFEIVTNNPAAA